MVSRVGVFRDRFQDLGHLGPEGAHLVGMNTVRYITKQAGPGEYIIETNRNPGSMQERRVSLRYL